jgi:hypothetical protein
VYVNSDALYRLAKEYQTEWLRWAARERLAAEARQVRTSRRTLREASPSRVRVARQVPDRQEAS